MRPLLVVAALALTALAALPALSLASSGAGDPDATSGRACGVELWAIKTMSDPGARSVNLTPKPTTIAALRRIPAPATLGSTRIAPVEKTTYRIRATLKEFKLEADSDIHLVVADARTGGTMIVEFPAPSCVAHATPAVKAKIVSARAALVRACGSPSASHFTFLRGTATISGVGFFDFKHGQTGVAPNAIELHPVLSFSGHCTSG